MCEDWSLETKVAPNIDAVPLLFVDVHEDSGAQALHHVNPQNPQCSTDVLVGSLSHQHVALLPGARSAVQVDTLSASATTRSYPVA